MAKRITKIERNEGGKCLLLIIHKSCWHIRGEEHESEKELNLWCEARFTYLSGALITRSHRLPCLITEISTRARHFNHFKWLLMMSPVGTVSDDRVWTEPTSLLLLANALELTSKSETSSVRLSLISHLNAKRKIENLRRKTKQQPRRRVECIFSNLTPAPYPFMFGISDRA